MIQAVIFDMDGVLVDSQICWNEAWESIAARYGKPWTEEDNHAMMGTRTTAWSAYAVEKAGLPLTPEQYRQQVWEYLHRMHDRGLRIMPGAVEIVQQAAENFRTGVASGSSRDLIERVMRYPEFSGKFQVAISSDEVPEGKPAPDVYLEACRRLDVQPSQSVCIEDSANGVLAGLRAGMKVIAVPDPHSPPGAQVLSQAHLVLPSLAALTLGQIHSLG